jgi:ribonucleoside-diphosphate reductase alpha chain
LPDAIAKVLSRHFEFRVNGVVEDKKILTNGHANGNEAPKTHTDTIAADQGVKEEIVKIEQLVIPAAPIQTQPQAFDQSSTGLYDICPECGGASLAYEEGCKKCYSCGYSEC